MARGERADPVRVQGISSTLLDHEHVRAVARHAFERFVKLVERPRLCDTKLRLLGSYRRGDFLAQRS